jgi:alpha-tubulin suppressor-like RCC1 family protein
MPQVFSENISAITTEEGGGFYSTGTQRLTQRWQKSLENKEDFVGK